MLCMLFQAAGSWYALEARHVREVAPYVAPRPCPGAPAWVAGIFSYRDQPAPVIDFSLLTGGKPCARRMSTRIIVLPFEHPSGMRCLGLLAGRVTVFSPAPSDFKPAGVAAAPYLGGIAALEQGMVQMIQPDKLITAEHLSALFENA